KAFRVFNKRTKRVEENLHVDFLESKLIEKGAGPNWLFDINTLTNSMNYVPVVSAGIISTNFSGTKEAASQDVKKDVSFLRYITLPNWFHEAHLETSTSNAQDACKADAPKSSGNSNPTATSTNPPTDQIETITVETLIPTISSPEEPKKISDALKDPSWVEAMQEELLQFKIQNVWSLVNYPEGVRPIGTKWVLKKKKDERGIVIKNKARGTIDQTLFIRKYKGDFILVQVYVDDIIFGSSNPLLCREFEAIMHEKFQMSAMGDILKKFGYSDVRSTNTPMDKENP
nr:copia protein [Tanacetum cinerariifolium]